jgi:hypothetical protein
MNNSNNLYQSMLLGSISGISETILQMPLITYKICRQNNRKLPKYILGWYRGTFIQCVSIAPITSFQVTFNSMLNNEFNKLNKLNNQNKIFISGFSGLLSAFIYTPVDFITIQQQKCKESFRNIITNNIKNKPILIFWRGLIPCIIRESIYVSGFLGLNTLISNQIKKKIHINNYISNIYSSLLTGVIVSVITHPFDTIKTIIQTDLNNKGFGNIAHILVKNKGLKGLYKGIIPRSLRTCGAFYIYLLIENKYMSCTY